MPSQAFRSRILHFIGDPNSAAEQAYEYYHDGVLLVEDGHISKVGQAAQLLPELNQHIDVEHLPNHLIVPGFIDIHTHYPQTEMVGAYGKQLLSWLDDYTFPTEMKFADERYARSTAKVFIDELLRNGTTTAMVFGTVHPESVHAFFKEAEKRKLRMIAGKVCMDRNAPAPLCDDAESAYQQSRALIGRWHGVARLQYALTPRFAPTCTAEQLSHLGQLLCEHEGLYVHTHLAENADEVAWVAELFPHARSYLDVYEQAGLLSRRSVFAHGIHLDDEDCKRLSENGSAIAHCPTSNLFLGSGLFDLQKMEHLGVNVGLGTDIGGGTSFSMLRTMDEAYKIQQLRGATLSPFKALYLATLGGARALDLDSVIGNFESGKEADFIMLNLHATPLLRYRIPFCQSLQDVLFVLNTLGDDRVITRTYSLGKCVHAR